MISALQMASSSSWNCKSSILLQVIERLHDISSTNGYVVLHSQVTAHIPCKSSYTGDTMRSKLSYSIQVYAGNYQQSIKCDISDNYVVPVLTFSNSQYLEQNSVSMHACLTLLDESECWCNGEY